MIEDNHINKIIDSAVREVLRNKMTLKLAAALIEKVESEATRMGVSVAIAVSDASARPVAIHCMDGSYIGSFDIALNKTFTSAGFKMPTKKLGELSQPGGPLYGIQHTNNGKVVIFGGGEPLIVNGTIIGAIGVSGGTVEEDTALAVYGSSIIEGVLSWMKN
ncbi:MAG: heme-binding protein [Clostridiales bacterium]|jgi:uncharacterized protein GlcG (DUF336 family)|nr:heme-binding protein [Clostridiales bacterium]